MRRSEIHPCIIHRMTLLASEPPVPCSAAVGRQTSGSNFPHFRRVARDMLHLTDRCDYGLLWKCEPRPA